MIIRWLLSSFYVFMRAAQSLLQFTSILRKKEVLGIFFFFFSAAVSAADWSIYVILQADGFLKEPAERALRQLERGFSRHPSLRGCVDLIEGKRGRRFLFQEEQEVVSECIIDTLADYLKSGCVQAFSQAGDRRTCMIFSGHGSGILTPVWDEAKQRFMVVPDVGDSPFMHYCRDEEQAFLQEIMEMQDRQMRGCKSLFLNNDNEQAISYGVIPDLVAFSADILGKKIDIIGFDGCTMALFELAYDLREHGHYLVASQALEEKEGWEYGAVLDLLHEQEPVHRIVRNIVYKYGAAQRLQQRPLYSLAACDLAAVDAASEALDRVVEVFIAALVRMPAVHQALMAARYKAVTAMRGGGILPYIDLALFLEDLYREIDALLETTEIALLKRAIIAALEKLQMMVIAHAGNPGAALTGCSVYLPHAVIDTSYHPAWALRHRWGDFLKICIGEL